MNNGLKKLLVLLGCLAVLSTATTGCSPVEKTLKLLIGDGGNKKTEVSLEPVKQSGEKGKGENTQGEKGEQYLGKDPQRNSVTGTAGAKADQNSKLGSEKIKVVLYFGSKDGQYLVKEVREIPKVEGIARATLEELLKGPGPESNLVQTVPNGTKLLDINIKPDGLAIVSFSGELKAKHWGGSAGEGNTVYSIVNTLTQFPSVQRVQILIEDQAVETLAGHLDISMPLERNPELIRSK
ncbi:MAG: GerMN domain-containing protein [Clostridia bacterium]|nr:GerMN domain-containing protein [Clostridia bacterium]